MDPKSTASQQPAPRPFDEPEPEIWMPAFERWQRITEALISGGKCASDYVNKRPSRM